MDESVPDLQPLTEDRIQEKLKEVPGWGYEDNKISKQFTFDSFAQAVNFVVKIVPFCDRIDHHPDICIYYKKITFSLTRFSIGGKVTERDFTIATQIEKLLAESK